jgi:hypothetical protein
MRAAGTFSVKDFTPTEVVPIPAVPTRVAVGVATMEKQFEGDVVGRSATTTGSDRTDEFFTIVPSSGTGKLAGISGAGGMTVDPDGTHRIWFDYELD